MACANCGTMILFGGRELQGRNYCNDQCLEAGRVTQAAEKVPARLVRETAEALHAGPCPRCGGPGPVDVHTSHSAWSALVVTSWKSQGLLCCGRCGRNAKLRAIAFTGAFGWWGYVGLVATPVQIGRTLIELMRGGTAAPSAALEEIARRGVAAHALENADDEPLRPRAQFRRAERAADARRGEPEA